jgi:hypothetical protein
MAVSVVFALHAAWRAADPQLHWRRFPGVVTGTADPRMVEVSVGSLADGDRIQVPVRPGHLYYNWLQVTVLENPLDPSDRRLAHWLAFADLWQPALWWLALLVPLGAARWLLTRARHGQRLVWRGGGWSEGEPIDIAPPAAVSGVRDSREAWKANLFWGAVLGIPAASAFFAGEGVVLQVFLGGAGLLWCGFMAWTAAESKTREVRVDPGGIEERSIWNIRRASWADVRKIEQVDVARELGGRRRRTSSARVVVWRLSDADGRQILSLPREMEPHDKLAALIRYAQARIMED